LPKIAFRIALSAILLAVLYGHFEARALSVSWRGAHPAMLAGGAALGLVGLAIQWLKWHRLLSAVRPGSAWKESLVSLFGGFALGALSPGRLGELGRAVFLPDQRARASAGAVADRLSSFVVTVALGLMGWWVADPPTAARASVAVASVGAAVCLGRRARSRLPAWRRLAALEARLDEGSATLGSLSPRRWLEVMGWSVLFNAVFFAQFYTFARAWGPVPGALVAAIPAIFALKALLPVGFMDLGVREGAAVFFFERLGMDPAVGLSAALLVFGVNVLAPAISGLAALTWAGLAVWPGSDGNQQDVKVSTSNRGGRDR